jgi:predicted aspartyl protease
VIKARLAREGVQTPDIYVLLDTGADTACFNTRVAEMLAIDWRSCSQVQYGGIGGGTCGYIHKVEISVGGYRYETDVIFIQNLPRSGLFGMHGFFDRFECRFNRAGGTITLFFDEEDGRIIDPAQP